MLNDSLHEVDRAYFKEYPAPMYEAMTRKASGEINSTAPFYGPMLYTIARAACCGSALEIGVAFGWSAGFMSWAIKENNSRFNTSGRYYGLDCADKSHLQKQHDAMGLPSTFIMDPKGSAHYLRNQTIWGPESLHLIFIDGWHNNKYVQREMELVYPLLKGQGDGYLCFHDIYAFIEESWPIFTEMKAPDANGIMRPAWEFIRFPQNYGFGVLRKMEGYDHHKVYWPDGDQKLPECEKDVDIVEASGEGK